MPTYVYECAKCGEQIEAYQSFTDEPLKRHTGCGGKLAKVLQPVGIVLKGSGFYKNDSRSSSSTSSPPSSESSGTSTPKKDSSDSSSTSPTTKTSESKTSTSKTSTTSTPAAPSTP